MTRVVQPPTPRSRAALIDLGSVGAAALDPLTR
jgi:hypothetical protein